jgi:hypothetical protein
LDWNTYGDTSPQLLEMVFTEWVLTDYQARLIPADNEFIPDVKNYPYQAWG